MLHKAALCLIKVLQMHNPSMDGWCVYWLQIESDIFFGETNVYRVKILKAESLVAQQGFHLLLVTNMHLSIQAKQTYPSTE